MDRKRSATSYIKTVYEKALSFTPLVSLHTRLKHVIPLLTHTCLLCQQSSTQRLCALCLDEFFEKAQHSCSRCALPLAHPTLQCGECLSSPPRFDHTVGAYLYRPPLSKLILRFKQQHDFTVGKALSDLLVKHIKEHYESTQHTPPNLIVCTPLHWRNSWQRGFNQSLFFANALSQKMSIPMFKRLKRVKYAPGQKELNKAQRMKNLRHSFTVERSLKGQHIAIVDDVMTTGATANSIAAVLKAAGAKQVSVWVLARTPKN